MLVYEEVAITKKSNHFADKVWLKKSFNVISSICLWCILAFLTFVAAKPSFAGEWKIKYVCEGNVHIAGSIAYGWPPSDEPWVDTQSQFGFTSYTGDSVTSAITEGDVHAVLTWTREDPADSSLPPTRLVIKEIMHAEVDGEGDEDDLRTDIECPFRSHFNERVSGWHQRYVLSTHTLVIDNQNRASEITLPTRHLKAQIEIAEYFIGPYGIGYGAVSYQVKIYPPHEHPTNFHVILPARDNGDAVLRWTYKWDSTSGLKDASDVEGNRNIDLGHIYVGEFVIYPTNQSSYTRNDPPWLNWIFPNNPAINPSLSDRNGNNGWITDENKLAGSFRHPGIQKLSSFSAYQDIRFHCDLCMDKDANGTPVEFDALMGPIEIQRTVEPIIWEDWETGAWKYSVKKHEQTAWKQIFWP